VKSWLTVAAVLLLVSSCATSPSGAGRTTALDSRPASGHWVGTFTSREMVSALGLMEAPVRLAIGDDGRWTLASSQGTVASGSTRRTAKSLRLEGRVTAGDPMTVGRELSFDLRPRRGGLFGEGQTFYLGHRVDTEVLLRAS